MKQLILFLAALIAVCSVKAGIPVVVVDDSDKGAVAGATVIGNSGIIIGMTDSEGKITVPERELPVTVRCMGYEPLATSADNTTIGLKPSAYRLNEVVVDPAERPIKRVICLVREFCSGITDGDTLQLYTEGMAEAFFADGKVKGYKDSDTKARIKNRAEYARIVEDGKESVFRPGRDNPISLFPWSGMIQLLPAQRIEVAQKIKDGAVSDTVAGECSPRFIRSRKNGLYNRSQDLLSDYKDHVWSPSFLKILGMSADLKTYTQTYSFADNGADSFGINDLAGGTANIELLGHGKIFKKAFKSGKPVEMKTYIEIYPLEITNCTVEEYKELRKDKSELPIRYPEGIQPMSPSIRQLVERIESQSPNQ